MVGMAILRSTLYASSSLWVAISMLSFTLKNSRSLRQTGRTPGISPETRHSTRLGAPSPQFNSKFFYTEVWQSLAVLKLTRQYSSEDLDAYIRRFHEKALGCCHQVDEEMLADICLHGMTEENGVFLEDLSFPSFSKLIEAARWTIELIRRPPKLNTSARPSQAPAAQPHAQKGLILVAPMIPKRPSHSP